MSRTLGDYAVISITTVASFASIVSYAKFAYPELNDQGVWGVIFTGSLSVFFLAYCIYLIAKYRKRIRYAEIFEDLNEGFTYIHRIERMDSPGSEVILQNLEKLCDCLSNAFSKINGVNIGVCIKVLTYVQKRPLVKTLVRDRKSIMSGRKTGLSDSNSHFIELNSDFSFIYANFDNDNIDTTYYFEPKLPVCKDYRNSRLNSNWPPMSYRVSIIDNALRRLNWPLKYRSTMVVPIVPLISDEQNQKAIRGFLCIDSPRENSFFEEIDSAILKGVCDGLYNKIDTLHRLMES